MRPLVSGFKSANSKWKSNYFIFRGGVAWPLRMPQTDPILTFSEYSEEDLKTLHLIHLDHTKDLSPFIFKEISEASLLHAAIKSSDPSPPINLVLI